ncbi:MAG TPA: metallophosphoesterase [Bryobacteraceae bacterium]|nr:metallophosphoesterase [Bryobacteraceae bacterium]
MLRRCGLWLACLAFALWADEPALDFIHLTDTHVIQLEGVDSRLVAARQHFRPSAKTLPAFLADAGGRYRPAFFLITGDLIDAFRLADVNGQVDAFTRATKGSPAPLYLALGNHDIANYGVDPAAGKLLSVQFGAGEARAAWIAAADCFRKGTYYSFEKQVGRATYLFLVLDNSYNTGEIAQEQMAWLRRQVSGHKNRAVIVAMHIPLIENATSYAIRSALSDCRVALVLAGHTHRDRMAEITLGLGPTVEVRTAAFGYGERHWRRVRLRQDRIEVYATGEPERVEKTIPLASAIMSP